MVAKPLSGVDASTGRGKRRREENESKRRKKKKKNTSNLVARLPYPSDDPARRSRQGPGHRRIQTRMARLASMATGEAGLWSLACL